MGLSNASLITGCKLLLYWSWVISFISTMSVIVSKCCYQYIPILGYAGGTLCKILDQKTWFLQGGVKLMQFNFFGNWSVFQLAISGTVEICKIICFWEIDEILTEKSPHIINWLLRSLYPHLWPLSCYTVLHIMKASLCLLPLLYEIVFASIVYLIASRVLFAFVTGQNYIHDKIF